MTLREFLIKRPTLMDTVFTAIGLVGIVFYFAIGSAFLSDNSKQSKMKKVSNPAASVKGKEISKKDAGNDSITLPEQMAQASSSGISLPSVKMIEQADSEANANMMESFKFSKSFFFPFNILCTDKEMNKNFESENIPGIKVTQSRDVDKGDDELNSSFMIDANWINVNSQYMIEKTDDNVNGYFNTSIGSSDGEIKPDILLNADLEITQNFRDNI